MSYLRKNCNVLNTTHTSALPSRIHRTIAKEILGADRRLPLTAISTRSGHTVPLMPQDHGGVTLHSRYNPIEEAQRMTAKLAPAGTVCVAGLGAGYHLRELLSHDDIVRVVVLCEPIPVLHSLFDLFDFSVLLADQRVVLTDTRDLPVLSGIIPRLHPTFFSTRIGTLSLRSFRNLYPNVEQKFRDAVADAVETISDDSTAQLRFARLWFRNTLLNLERVALAKPARLASEKTTVLAAGPSLDRFLQRPAFDPSEGYLVCDTAAPAASRAGVPISSCISIDPSLYNYHHLLSGAPTSVPWILDASVHPLLWRSLPDATAIANKHPLWNFFPRLAERLPIPERTTDVCSAAVSLSLSAGCRNISIYGADYTYLRGRTYARGSYIDRLFLSSSSRTSTELSQSFSFLFRSPHARRTDDGNYQHPGFESAASGLISFCKTKSASIVRYQPGPDNCLNGFQIGAQKPARTTNEDTLPAPISPQKARDDRPSEVQVGARQLRSAIESLPPIGELTPEAYYRGLNPYQRVVAEIVAPIAYKCARAPDFSNGLSDESIAEAKSFAIGVIECVHQKPGTRILS